MEHKPLSKSLEALFKSAESTGGFTMNQLLEGTEGRGFHLMIVFLSLPFVTPIPLVGASSLCGSIIMMAAGRLAFAMPHRLPRLIGDKRITLSRHPKLISGSVKLLKIIEKWIKPRRTSWLSWQAARSGNAILLALMAFLLALPLPFPFTNALPAYAIIFLAASMMEEDGVLVWLGYAIAIITMLYFAFWAGAIMTFLTNLFYRLFYSAL